MMGAISRADWETKRYAWRWAIAQAAEAIGKGKPLYNILGSAAWGRFDGEASPGEVKDNVVFGVGFLEGVRYAALHAGRELHLEGTVHLERIHDRMRLESKK
jgi:hypothetical protein